MNVTVQFSAPASTPNLLTLRYALDPQIVAMLAPEPSNFSHFTYWSVNGRFGDVHNYVPLGAEWEQYLLTINPADARNKLINDDGEAEKVFWYVGGKMVYGNMVPGSTLNYKNKVRVKTNADGSIKTTRMRLKPPAYDSAVNMDMVEVDGFRKSDKGRLVSELIAEGRMGYFTEISSNWKVYRALGGYANLLCPYWGEDFPPKYGKSYLPIAYFEGYGLTI